MPGKVAEFDNDWRVVTLHTSTWQLGCLTAQNMVDPPLKGPKMVAVSVIFCDYNSLLFCVRTEIL